MVEGGGGPHAGLSPGPWGREAALFIELWQGSFKPEGTPNRRGVISYQQIFLSPVEWIKSWDSPQPFKAKASPKGDRITTSQKACMFPRKCFRLFIYVIYLFIFGWMVEIM